ncbi:hypothetical protein RvY_05677 [Ramazzottius varieornatus]|uniref:SH3 domain-containing protein n=1 Tax=Ramazzottius varieornatus TaxID=947166 RepID=A0A1D1V1G8_RAMVA|nr:hypothetical protein RvY_05677 [Ramazzottius varieornatus]
MALSMKNYKGYDKFPYCDAHVPKPGFTTIVDTPENKRLADNTAKQSGIAYHSDFEKSKGKFTTVADDPETLRLMQNANTVSNIGYHGIMDHKNQMEASRQPYGDGQDPSQQQQNYIAPYQSTQPAEEPRSTIEYQPAATPSQWKKGFPPNQPPLSASNVSPSNSLSRESSHREHSQNGTSSLTRYHNDLQLSVGNMLAKGPSSSSSARATVPASSKSSDYRTPSHLMSTPPTERPKVGSLADYDPLGENRGQPSQQPSSGGYQPPQGQSQQQQRPQQAAQPPPYQQPQQQQGAAMQRQTSYGGQPGAGAAPAYGQHQGAGAAAGGFKPQQQSQPAFGGVAYGQQSQPSNSYGQSPQAASAYGQSPQSGAYGQSPQAAAYGQPQQGPRPSFQTQVSGPKPYSPQPQSTSAFSGPKPYSPQSAGPQPYSPGQQSYGQSPQQPSSYGQPSFAQSGTSSYPQQQQQHQQSHQQQQSKQFTGTNAFSAAYGDAGQHPLHSGGPQPLHSQAQGSSSMYGQQQAPQSNTYQPASQSSAYQPVAGGPASQFSRQPQQQQNQPYSSPAQGATSWPPKQGQSNQQDSKAPPPWLQQQGGHSTTTSPSWSQQQGNQTTQQSYSSHATTTQSHQQQAGRGGPSIPSKSAKEYKAMYDYNAADVDEVSFRDGDVIVNVQPIDAGWMIGTVKRTGKSGMLPSNYVTPV